MVIVEFVWMAACMFGHSFENVNVNRTGGLRYHSEKLWQGRFACPFGSLLLAGAGAGAGGGGAAAGGRAQEFQSN